MICDFISPDGDHREFFSKNCPDIPDPSIAIAREWDYNADAKIGLGIMYQVDAPTYEEGYPVADALSNEDRDYAIRKFLESRM